MSIPPPAEQELEAEVAADPAVVRAEGRVQMLRELAEIGMELVRELRPQAQAAQPPASDAAPRRDPAELYTTLSRAIRLTLALEAKTDESLTALKQGLTSRRGQAHFETGARRGQLDAERERARRHQVSECLRTVAEWECETREQFQNFNRAMQQRFELDMAYTEIASRPLRETVERLCHDLCLNPDWSRWEGEGWNTDHLPPRPPFSIFNQRSPKPIEIPPELAALDVPDPLPPPPEDVSAACRREEENWLRRKLAKKNGPPRGGYRVAKPPDY